MSKGVEMDTARAVELEQEIRKEIAIKVEQQTIKRVLAIYRACYIGELEDISEEKIDFLVQVKKVFNVKE